MIYWAFLTCFILTIILAGLIGNEPLKYKKLNIILALLVLINLIFAVVFLYEFVPIFIRGIVTYLQNMTSSLDAVVLVALITGTITLLNSFYSRYSDQKNKKREYLASKREGPYSDLFTMIQKISRNGKNGFVYPRDDMLKDINEFNSKLSLWGSPRVVKKWIEFRRKSLEGNEQLKGDELLKAVEDVMNEMRKDLGSKSTKKGELLSIFLNDAENLLEKRKK